MTDAPIVRLHGDAHVGQFAFTRSAWGLDDFDDSARGPSFIDIVRFLGSIELATRQRGWSHDRDALWDRFFEGYRSGLSNPEQRPPEPGIVRELRRQSPTTRRAYLAWGEKQMQPTDAARLKLVDQGMEVLDRVVRREHPNLSSAYFTVKRAGWLRIGVGSAVKRKVLAFDSGFQLGAGNVASVRGQALSSNVRPESRLRKETASLVEELLAGWRELGGR